MLGALCKAGKVLLADRQKHPRRGLNGRGATAAITTTATRRQPAKPPHRPHRSNTPTAGRTRAAQAGNRHFGHLGGKDGLGVNDMDPVGKKSQAISPQPAKPQCGVGRAAPPGCWLRPA